ncbi:MAG TPA: hypothetical protein VJR67_00400 [Candidatus Nitrosopolaris sp.]|nr:hypothetical protein [Candidatus Nitrosopolaris sp.]
MSRPIRLLQFRTVAKSASIWKSVTSAVMTVTDGGQFQAGPEGIRFSARDRSHEIFIDVEIPNTAFQEYLCPSLLQFGVRLGELSQIMRREANNTPIEISIQDTSLIVDTNSCRYKLNLPESSTLISRLSGVSFDTKMIIRKKTLADILHDVRVFSDRVGLRTILVPEIATSFSAITDIGSASVTITGDSCAPDVPHQTSRTERSEAIYSLGLVSNLLDSICCNNDYVQLEYSSGSTLRLKFLLENSVRLQIYVAAQIDI